MNKKLQDLVWSVLPKEFKEEVKKIYYNLLIKSTISQYDSGIMKTLVSLFGIHNLTSDAEGEEIFYVSRKQVQEMYSDVETDIADYQGNGKFGLGAADPTLCERAKGMRMMLRRLFGSKCLPDENYSNVEKLEKNDEPVPSEPKFKVGDKVVCLNYPHVWRQVTAILEDGSYVLDGAICDVKESDLEPYTEPTNEDFVTLGVESAEYLRKSLEESEYRNSSQNIENCDKQFDTIFKDSFSKERRLNIAAMVMQGVMANPNPQMVEMDAHRVADLAILMADTLIAECEKGDKK